MLSRARRCMASRAALSSQWHFDSAVRNASVMPILPRISRTTVGIGQDQRAEPRRRTNLFPYLCPRVVPREPVESGDVHSFSTGQSYVSSHPARRSSDKGTHVLQHTLLLRSQRRKLVGSTLPHLSQLVDAVSVSTRLPTEATLPRSTNAADTFTAPWPVCSGSQ